jgi:hypothetical protein
MMPVHRFDSSGVCYDHKIDDCPMCVSLAKQENAAAVQEAKRRDLEQRAVSAFERIADALEALAAKNKP